jgi:nucleoid-associated protein YgaU
VARRRQCQCAGFALYAQRTNEEAGMDDKSQQGGGAQGYDATQWHVVEKGETLSKIAERYYGDASLYPKIFEANRDVLKDPNMIRIGQKLRIP